MIGPSETEEEAARRAQIAQANEHAHRVTRSQSRLLENARRRTAQFIHPDHWSSPPVEPVTAIPRKRSKNARTWRRRYLNSMNLGHQRCRLCGRSAVSRDLDPIMGLVFAHLKPRSKKGTDGKANMTIACTPCDDQMSNDDWSGRLPSLQDEENGLA